MSFGKTKKKYTFERQIVGLTWLETLIVYDMTGEWNQMGEANITSEKGQDEVNWEAPALQWKEADSVKSFLIWHVEEDDGIRTMLKHVFIYV